MLSPANSGDDGPPKPPGLGTGATAVPDIGNTQVSDETFELQEAAGDRREKRDAGRNAQEARNARLKAEFDKHGGIAPPGSSYTAD